MRRIIRESSVNISWRRQRIFPQGQKTILHVDPQTGWYRGSFRKTSHLYKGAHPIDVLRDYTQETTLHGMRYISKPGVGVIDRVMWAMSVALCIGASVVLVYLAWRKFAESPIVTSVESTVYPLRQLPFPAVTVCPANTVRRSVALKLLMAFLNKTTEELGMEELKHFLQAMASYRYPTYQFMVSHLNRSLSLLPLLEEFNITDFMRKVLPTCTDVFEGCIWQHIRFNCCEMFHLQPFERGFCYSFNSLTSEKTYHCAGLERSGDNRCRLLRNGHTGSGTGLQIFFRSVNTDEFIAVHDHFLAGIRILVHGPASFPEAGNGLFLLDRSLKMGTVKVSPSVLESSRELGWMRPTLRNCYFADERRLRITDVYTQTNCLLECRLRTMVRMCHCLPYFYGNLLPNVKECSVTKLQCFVNTTVEMSLLNIQVNASKLQKCQDSCLPSCFNTVYDVDASFAEDSKPTTRAETGYLDVFYQTRTVVKYLRTPAVDQLELLVSLGGIVGLFLGVSLLSLVELFYFLYRLTSATFRLLFYKIDSKNKNICYGNVW